MTGYVRKDTSNNIADGNIINAADLDAEFDGVQDAFNSTTGHKHDGTSGEGAPITVVGPVQDVVISATAVTPKTTNTVDIGSSSLRFKDIFITGTATLPTVSATTVGATTGNITTVNATTVDTTNIEVTTLRAKDGTSAGSIADSTGIVTLASSVLTTADINGGTLDNVIIGGSTAAAASFTTLTTSSTVTLNGGTANGVAYLNGSKVLTTGSALTFDGTRLTTTAFTVADGANGTVRFGSDSNYNITGGIDNGGFRFNLPSGVDYQFRFAGGDAMRLTSTGLGIGTSSPSAKLEVAAARGTYALNIYNSSDGSVAGQFGSLTGNVFGINATGPANTMTFLTGGSEAMRLTSTGLGIGTSSPAGPLHVVGTADQIRAGNGTVTAFFGGSGSNGYTGTLTNHSFLFYTNSAERMRLDTSGNLGIGTSSPNEKLVVNGAVRSSSNAVSVTASAGAVMDYFSGMARFFATDGSAVGQMNLDKAGNLGLGVTPSAWSGFTASQVSRGSIAANTSEIDVSLNAYYDGSNWRYIANGFATNHYQFNGTYAWRTAPSGTAGNAISFTQAMTLDASGNLGVGTTSPAGKLSVNVDASTELVTFRSSGGRQIWAHEPGGNARPLTIKAQTLTYADDTATRLTLDSSGNLLVGTTGQTLGTARLSVSSAGLTTVSRTTTATESPYAAFNSATSGNNQFMWFYTGDSGQTFRGSIEFNRGSGVVAYNTTSDYRAKDIIGPVTDSGSVIDSVPVYIGKMKGASQERPMFIAHETPLYAHTGEKDAVDANGNPVYQQMDASALVPVMWAEIQSLRKRLAAAGIA